MATNRPGGEAIGILSLDAVPPAEALAEVQAMPAVMVRLDRQLPPEVRPSPVARRIEPSGMATPSDPYKDWLGIPLAERPPHHYRLLGIAAFEDDPNVIDLGASRQAEKIKQAAAGCDPALVQKLLLELSKQGPAC